MSLIRGVRHFGIVCKDIKKSLKFYKDFLEMEVIQDFWDNSDYINEVTDINNANVHMIKLKANDGTILELLDYVTHPTELLEQKVYNVGATHLAFQVDDIEEVKNNLEKKGVTFLSKPVLSSEGIAKVCFCFDPNNIRIELVELV